ncbi:hypothetical protein HaLaN_10630, partial [Haematococcus lacustris]
MSATRASKICCTSGLHCVSHVVHGARHGGLRVCCQSVQASLSVQHPGFRLYVGTGELNTHHIAIVAWAQPCQGHMPPKHSQH